MADSEIEEVILVNENDVEVGTEEKMESHLNGGKLHRAFSIFIFNSEGELMLQKRAEDKYHCAGLWTNTCCSHPRPGESLKEATQRRLKEEMGFTCPLKEIFSFQYRADFSNGLTENEIDHVFIGKYDGEPELNEGEASDWMWIGLDKLEEDMKKNPEKYTPWFKISIPKVIEHVREKGIR